METRRPRRGLFRGLGAPAPTKTLRNGRIVNTFHSMKRLALLFVLLTTAVFAADKSVSLTSAEAAKLVADGKAVLVDVREPSEWNETGVAGPAVLLSTTDFKNNTPGWQEFLKTVGDKTIITYCRAGVRAGRIAGKLEEQGYKVENAGKFTDWKAAGLPVRKADAK